LRKGRLRYADLEMNLLRAANLLVMRSEVFADDDRLLGRCLVEGNSLGPIVALQLCFFMLFGGWAGRLGDLALRREAVYVPLP
jgi:hypothetical protein